MLAEVTGGVVNERALVEEQRFGAAYSPHLNAFLDAESV